MGSVGQPVRRGDIDNGSDADRHVHLLLVLMTGHVVWRNISVVGLRVTLLLWFNYKKKSRGLIIGIINRCNFNYIFFFTKKNVYFFTL